MKRKLVRILWVVLLLVIAISAVGVGYGAWVMNRTLPPEAGRLELAGLGSEVEILFDARGIPQIYAQTERDAYAALGYLHAANRLFQMEIARRAAAGRLAEMLGPALVEVDRMQRLIGHYALTRPQLQALSPRVASLIAAYVQGINARVAAAGPSFEFSLLGTDFERWTPHDVLALASFQTWYADNLQAWDDVLYPGIRRAVGPERAAELVAPYPAWVPSVVPTPGDSIPPAPDLVAVEASLDPLGRVIDRMRAKIARQLVPNRAAAERLIRSAAMGAASNAWAVDPAHSTTGSALFANDPHLEIVTLPGFWYMAGLHAADADLDAVGITVAGIPGILMGHTPRSAWGFTVAGIDLRDHYRLALDPSDSTRYRTVDGWDQMRRWEERIEVKGADPVIAPMEWSRLGPVVERDSTRSWAIAWHWAGLDLPVVPVLEGAFDLPLARDWDAFRTAVNGSALNLGWVYADASGNIGYALGPRVPRRDFNPSRLPVDGADERFAWQGYYERDESPHALNPARGWLASTNNPPVPPNASLPLPGSYHIDRALRIAELLSGDSLFAPEDMKRFQLDQTDRYAARWAKPAAAILRAMGHEALADRVGAWQGSMDPSSPEAALVALWRTQLAAAIFHDEFDEWLPSEVFERIFNGGAGSWYDDVRTEEVEGRDTVLVRAMRAAVDSLQGRDWGEVLALRPRHPFAEIRALSWVLGLERGPYTQGGSAGSLNSRFNRYLGGGRFAVTAGPSWRQLVDLGNVDAAEVVLPFGQSAHPWSDHFFDFYEDWQAGRYWNVPLSRARVEERSVSRLVLGPGEGE